ncbi:hypothetical protein [Streptomyces sp. ICC4]|uniref:hypothetical protein n=1 Tax=Streptomyces sp. ICC4 TaxID=2099584 RepID=UPI0031B9CAD9
MGRHSRKEPAPAPGPGHPEPDARAASAPTAGGTAAGARAWAEPTVTHQGYVPAPRPGQPSGARGGHPQQYEPGGAWGAPAPSGPVAAGSVPAGSVPGSSVYGDWRGAPRGRGAPAGGA